MFGNNGDDNEEPKTEEELKQKRLNDNKNKVLLSSNKTTIDFVANLIGWEKGKSFKENIVY